MPPAREIPSTAADKLFIFALAAIGGVYVTLIAGMLLADGAYVLEASSRVPGGWLEKITANPVLQSLGKPEIQHAIWLTLFSCTAAAVLSLVVAVPSAYILTRTRFPLRRWVDAALDIPVVLPPLVVGLSLLILFQFPPFSTEFGNLFPFLPDSCHGSSLGRLVVYQVPAVILAQFAVAGAFASRIMKTSFDQISPRCEQVALTLGCSRLQAFVRVVLPEARRGMMTAFTMAWARSLGEFGPLLIFAGATRNKTEVLSTTVFLEMSIGNIEAAVAVSLLMVFAAAAVLVAARAWGSPGGIP